MLERRRAFVHVTFCALYLGCFFLINRQAGGFAPMREFALLLIAGGGIGVAYHVYHLLLLGFQKRKPLLAILYFIIGLCLIVTVGYLLFGGSEHNLSAQMVDPTAEYTVRDYLLSFGTWYFHLGKYGVIFFLAEKQLFEKLDLLLSRYWPKYVVVPHGTMSPPVAGGNQLVRHFFNNLLHRIYNRLGSDEKMNPMQLARLSNLVKYGTVNHLVADRSTAPLKDEISAVHDLLSMEEGHGIHLQVKGDTDSFTIPPMVLLSIAKNMIKHGGARSEKGEAILDIRVEGSSMHVIGTNGLLASPQWTSPNGGQGLQQMRRLLKEVYGNRATLYTTIFEDCFYLYLRIDHLTT